MSCFHSINTIISPVREERSYIWLRRDPLCFGYQGFEITEFKMEMGNSIAETQKEKSRETCFSSRKGEFTV